MGAGSNEHFQLGINKIETFNLNLVSKIQKNVSYIHLGRYSSYLIKENGDLIGFGKNKKKQKQKKQKNKKIIIKKDSTNFLSRWR